MDITNGRLNVLKNEAIKNNVQEFKIKEGREPTHEELTNIVSTPTGFGYWFSGVFHDRAELKGVRPMHSLYIGTRDGARQTEIMKELYGFDQLPPKIMSLSECGGKIIIVETGGGGGVVFSRKYDYEFDPEHFWEIITVNTADAKCYMPIDPDEYYVGYVHMINRTLIPKPKWF